MQDQKTINPYKGYRNARKKLFRRPDNVEQDPSKWTGGTLSTWSEFKNSFYNSLRVGHGWNLEKPASEEELKTEKPSGLASADALKPYKDECDALIASLTGEEQARPGPGRNPSPAENFNQLMIANQYKVKRQKCIDSYREICMRLNDKAEAAVRMWSVENEKKILRDVVTLKIFNERFRRIDLELVDAEFLQVGNFRGALDKLEKIFVGGAQRGQARMLEIRSAIMDFKYKKNEGLDTLIDKVERCHKKLKFDEDITFSVVQEAIEKGDDELLKKQLESMKPLIETYKDLKRVMKEQIISNNHAPKHSSQKGTESAHITSQSRPICKVCGKLGHTSNVCWTEMTCKNCGKKGHIESRCRARNQNPNTGTEMAQTKGTPTPQKRKVELVANFDKKLEKNKKV